MKKFLVLLVIAAMTCLSSMAFAADVSVNGSIDYLMRSFVNIDLKDATHDNKNFTLERVRLNVDAKAGDALSGRIGLENDWDTWGRFEAKQANMGGGLTTTVTNTTTGKATTVGNGTFIGLREAWIGFKMPGTPLGVKGGHMLLQLGNGWWFRDMKYGSDAWVVYTDINALHLGIVNIKVSEGVTTASDDTDAYAFVATYKLSDTMSAGVNFTTVNDRQGKAFNSFYGYAAGTVVGAQMQNLEVHFAGTIGPAKLKAEVDVQSGDAQTSLGGANAKKKFSGNQVVLEAAIPVDAVTINATLARGSGAKATDTDFKEYVALMDADVHYTLIYEYLLKTAAKQSFKTTGTGFGNTTAISVGGAFNVSKNLMVGADLWLLQATSKFAPYAGAADTSDLGTEVDAKVNWKMYENLTWNTTIGYFMPGDAYKINSTTDATTATAIQSVLSFKF